MHSVMMDGCLKFQAFSLKRKCDCVTVTVTVFTNLCIVSGYPGEFCLFFF